MTPTKLFLPLPWCRGNPFGPRKNLNWPSLAIHSFLFTLERKKKTLVSKNATTISNPFSEKFTLSHTGATGRVATPRGHFPPSTHHPQETTTDTYAHKHTRARDDATAPPPVASTTRAEVKWGAPVWCVVFPVKIRSELSVRPERRLG